MHIYVPQNFRPFPSDVRYTPSGAPGRQDGSLASDHGTAPSACVMSCHGAIMHAMASYMYICICGYACMHVRMHLHIIPYIESGRQKNKFPTHTGGVSMFF